MIELSLSLQEHLARSLMLHSRLCPRQVLGVRMARLACTLLNIDPALNRKSIYVYMEMGHCAADAAMVVTGASPTNGLMRLMDYGKLAATFVNLASNAAIRISERQGSREIALRIMHGSSAWEAQRDAYQTMPDDQLFNWQPVLLKESLPYIAEKHSVNCQSCGDRINEHSEVVVGGQTLCKACAFGAYFETVEMQTQPHHLQPMTYTVQLGVGD